MDLSPAGSTKEDILTVIVDLQKGKTIVFPAQSEGYEEFENFTFQAYAADPFQTVKNLEKTAQKKMIGEETLSGFLCRHYAYYDQDFKLADVWYAKDLQSFPIKAHIVSGRDDGAVKAKTNIGDTKLELSNIRIETVDAGMFLLPSGLLKRNSDKKEKNKPPAVTSILEGASPWGRRITGGGEIHVNTDPDRPVQIIFEYLSNDGVCKYWAIPAGKNADEIKPVMKGYPEKGRLRKIEIDKNKKVERVIIRADAGTIFARVVNKPDPFSFGKDEKIEEGYLIEKELKGITTDPEKTLTVTVTGDYQDGPDSEVTLVCYRKQYEDKVLEKKVIISNEQTEIWKFGPDDHVKTIELSVGEKGGIKYRIQQPDEQAF
ncbi:MAG: hypothetical protein JW927_18810 [Deltaproteobacteria bacterium]|nr:hypothetical protein [Deltaproteobacteria bacterium]